jgi:hypothetical protein
MSANTRWFHVRHPPAGLDGGVFRRDRGELRAGCGWPCPAGGFGPWRLRLWALGGNGCFHDSLQRSHVVAERCPVFRVLAVGDVHDGAGCFTVHATDRPQHARGVLHLRIGPKGREKGRRVRC